MPIEIEADHTKGWQASRKRYFFVKIRKYRIIQEIRLAQTRHWVSRSKKENELLHNLGLGKPILSCKQKLILKRQRILCADISTLSAEDTAGNINPDTFLLFHLLGNIALRIGYLYGHRRIDNLIDRMCGADLQTQAAAVTGRSIIRNLSAECRRCLNRRYNLRFTFRNRAEETGDRFRQAYCREQIGHRLFHRLCKNLLYHRKPSHPRSPPEEMHPP